MKRVAFATSGCRANQYDTAALESVLSRQNCSIVDFKEEADVYVVNSCAITAQAEVDARQYARRARRKNPHAKIIVTGCAAQTNAGSFKEEGIELVVGNEGKAVIAEMIMDNDMVREPHHVQEKGHPEPRRRVKEEIFFDGGVRLAKHSRSFLKIQDGCSQFCSFCIVPFARGLNRSIDPARVIEALFELREKGMDEAVITGIHLGTYGKDLKEKYSFYDLLKQIERLKPLPRIRLSSLDPEEVGEEILELVASSSIFCPHFHLPLQSGDDEVLRRMRRRYTARHFEELTVKIEKRMPQACIGTDVIVGFPGESEGAFENTLRVVRDSPLHYVHAFPYSTRKGTKAASFEGQVSAEVKKERMAVLLSLSREKRRAFYERHVGQTFQVVLENKRGVAYGLTPNYISVKLPFEQAASGLKWVKILGVDANDEVYGEGFRSSVMAAPTQVAEPVFFV